MRTLKTIIKQKPVYLGDWQSKEDLICEFEDLHPDLQDDDKEELKQTLKEWEDINILFAVYDKGSYDGRAFILLEKAGELYEVNAAHCSCFGLEGLFNLEETSLKVLEHRLIEGTLGLDYSDGESLYQKELKDFLGIKSKK